MGISTKACPYFFSKTFLVVFRIKFSEGRSNNICQICQKRTDFLLNKLWSLVNMISLFILFISTSITKQVPKFDLTIKKPATYGIRTHNSNMIFHQESHYLCKPLEDFRHMYY